jgi:hypothetical protein
MKLVYTTVYLFWAFIFIYVSIEDSSGVVLGFIHHTQILFFKEPGDVINFFPYVCKCGSFFIFLIMYVARCFLFCFLINLLYCFRNVIMEMDIVKYSLDNIFLFFFLIVEIGYSNILFIRYLVPETICCIGWQETFDIIRSVLAVFLWIAEFLSFATS